ncbi:hypothetical protein SCHPADRAFT_943705 [Schizopora paradoxa]|uniref:Uncharacterized protein n=1 Tax=Schizopora paradoxa TaxID=27342 RepID=A0A0H2RX30_9AGAM|nr:hypothetical protein SCHPADRAFT_943705 [Schizopora paradoxa]
MPPPPRRFNKSGKSASSLFAAIDSTRGQRSNSASLPSSDGPTPSDDSSLFPNSLSGVIDSPGPSTALVSRSNKSRTERMASFAKRHVQGKRLKTAQATEVTDFAILPLEEQMVVMYTNLVQLRDATMLKGNPLAHWVVSENTETNLQAYARIILLSSSLKSYTTNSCFNLLMGIARKFQWDLPKGIFEVPSAKKKLETRVRYHLTQERSKLLKKISASVGYFTKSDTFDTSKAIHIYDLAIQVTSKTRMTISRQLLCRLALMRYAFVSWKAGDADADEEEEPDAEESSATHENGYSKCEDTKDKDRYWSQMTRWLRDIENQYKTAEDIVFFFKGLLDKDMDTYNAPASADLQDICDGAPEESEVHVTDMINSCTEHGLLITRPTDGNGNGVSGTSNDEADGSEDLEGSETNEVAE